MLAALHAGCTPRWLLYLENGKRALQSLLSGSLERSRENPLLQPHPTGASPCQGLSVNAADPSQHGLYILNSAQLTLQNDHKSMQGVQYVHICKELGV